MSEPEREVEKIERPKRLPDRNERTSTCGFSECHGAPQTATRRNFSSGLSSSESATQACECSAYNASIQGPTLKPPQSAVP